MTYNLFTISKIYPQIQLFAVLALLLINVPHTAQATDVPQATKEADNVTLHIPQIHTASLANGLRLMVVENHRAPVVSHAITYLVGSIDEQPNERGIAHLLEHMLFRGTNNYSEAQIIQMHKRLGDNYNASTSFDATRYYHRIRPQNLEEIMAFEADRMQNVIFNEQKFKTERNVVREERNQRISNSKRSLLREETFGSLFRSHPYQYPIIGFHNDINNLTIEKTIAFYRRHYRPSNAMVAVVGDVSWTEVLRLAKKHYGPLINQDSQLSTNRAVFFEPPQQSYTTREGKDKKAVTSTLSLLWKTPSLASNPATLAPDDFRIQGPITNLEKDVTSEDFIRHVFALTIAANILNNTSENLYQKLVEEQRLASHIGSFADSWNRGPGTLGIYIKAADKETSPQILKETLLSHLDNLSNLITPHKVTLAKKAILLSLAYSVDSLESLSLLLNDLFIIGMSPEQFAENVELFRSISHNEVLAAFSFYIKETPFLMNIVTPLAMQNTKIPEQ